MPKHLTQLTLTDVQLAAVMNAVQVAIVMLRLHQDVQSDRDYVRGLSQGFAACDSINPEAWKEVHTMLSVALEDLEDENITPVPHVPSERDTPKRRFDPDLLN